MQIKIELQKKRNLSDKQNAIADAISQKYKDITLEYEMNERIKEHDNVQYKITVNGKTVAKGTDPLFRVESDWSIIILNVLILLHNSSNSTDDNFGFNFKVNSEDDIIRLLFNPIKG